MSSYPSTFRGEPRDLSGLQWDDRAALHRRDDKGGLFYEFKALRHGTLAELVSFVISLPEHERGDYAIEKAGDHRLELPEIRFLAGRADFPGR